MSGGKKQQKCWGRVDVGELESGLEERPGTLAWAKRRKEEGESSDPKRMATRFRAMMQKRR
jgi:hypothetical protein